MISYLSECPMAANNLVEESDERSHSKLHNSPAKLIPRWIDHRHEAMQALLKADTVQLSISMQTCTPWLRRSSLPRSIVLEALEERIQRTRHCGSQHRARWQ